MSLRAVGYLVILTSWIAFVAIFTWRARLVHRRRNQDPLAESNRKSAPAAIYGIILEGLGIVFACVPGFSAGATPEAVAVAGMVLAVVSVWLGGRAIRELGQQWRIQAVVTEKHQLITTGAYAWVRHPIYASLLGMAISTGLIVGRWQHLLIALVLYIAGTEIRIHEEEKLLSARFGAQFAAYRARVHAYIPGIR